MGTKHDRQTDRWTKRHWRYRSIDIDLIKSKYILFCSSMKHAKQNKPKE